MASYQSHDYLWNAMKDLGLKGRKCHTYVPYRKSDDGEVRVEVKSTEEPKDKCWCRQSKKAHRYVVENNEEKWNIDHHTFIEPIVREDCGPPDLTKDKPKYVRCDIKTPPKILEELLINIWKIKQPDLLLSVIGGAKYFKMSDQLEEKFCHTIIDATRRSNAWLLTNGFNVGIVQMVGRALKKTRLTTPEEDITAIAVTKYGCIRGDSSIIKNIEPIMNEQNVRRHGEHSLEPYHTHYILLDDGTKRRYDGIEEPVAVLMNTVSKGQSSENFPKPAVTIVVEGGYTTIMSMYYSLFYDMPVVLVAGSGRIADFFARWLSYLEGHFDDDQHEERHASARRVFQFHQRPKSKNTPVFFPMNSRTSRLTTTTNTFDSSVDTNNVCIDVTNPALEIMFERFRDEIHKDLRHVLSHQSEEIWQIDQPKRLEKRIDKLLPYVMYCLQPAVRSNIFRFDLSGDDNLTDAILRSVYYARRKIILDAEYRRKQEKNKQHPDNVYSQEISKTPDEDPKQEHMEQRRQHDREMLELALKWNCLEVAKELIVRGSIENMKLEEQEKTVLTMLVDNLPAFLHYFIELGTSLPNLILGCEQSAKKIDIDTYNNKLMEKLYSDERINDMYKTTNCLLFDINRLNAIDHDMIETESSYIMLDHIQISHRNNTQFGPFQIGKIDMNQRQANFPSIKKYLSVKGLNYILEELIGDDMDEIYSRSKNDTYINGHIINISKKTKTVSLSRDSIIDITFRDLFIWAILMNYIDMAKMLLAHINHRISAALIARKILRSLRDKYAIYQDKKTEYTKAMDYFENYAIDCVTLCYKHNQDKACELVLRECEHFGNVTCLSIAIKADAKRFVGQPCCVRAMLNVWHGMIDVDKTGLLRLFVTICTGGLSAGLTVDFRKNVGTDLTKEENQLEKNNLKPYGIIYSDPYELQYISPRSSYGQTKRSLSEYVKTHSLRIYYFHQAPATKFAYDCVYYFSLLLLFSYVVLFQFNPPTEHNPSVHSTEILLIILVSSMLVAEMRSVVSHEACTLAGKIKHYFTTPLKIIGFLSYGLFYIGLVLRFSCKEPTGNFFWARIVMGYTLQIWWLSAIRYINVVPSLGPHIVAIYDTLKDLAFFVCLMSITMCGYGTASRSIAYYGNITFTADGIFHDIMYPVYYLMHSQLDSETAYLDSAVGANWSIAVHILLAFNMLLLVIILINLLIALFNKRFEKVQEDAKNIWHNQQYRIVREYFHKTTVLHPLNVFIDIYKLLCIFFNWIRKRNHQGRYAMKVFKMIDENPLLKKSWDEFEGASTYEYAQSHALTKKTKTEEIIKSSNILSQSIYISSDKKTKYVFEDEESKEKSLETMFHELSSTVNKSLEEMKSNMIGLKQLFKQLDDT